MACVCVARDAVGRSITGCVAEVPFATQPITVVVKRFLVAGHSGQGGEGGGKVGPNKGRSRVREKELRSQEELSMARIAQKIGTYPQKRWIDM